MAQIRKMVGTMKRQARNIPANRSPKPCMPPDASTGLLSSHTWSQYNQDAATTRTPAYPAAISPACIRPGIDKEMDFINVVYRARTVNFPDRPIRVNANPAPESRLPGNTLDRTYQKARFSGVEKKSGPGSAAGPFSLWEFSPRVFILQRQSARNNPAI